MSKNDPIILRVPVSVDPDDEIGNRTRCPIAWSIVMGDRDTTHVRVDREYISFSRRSDNMRRKCKTPVEPKEYIDALDKLADKKDVTEEDLPEDIILTLRQSDLISMLQKRVHNRKRGGKTAITKTVGEATGTSKTKIKKRQKPKSQPGALVRRPVVRAT